MGAVGLRFRSLLIVTSKTLTIAQLSDAVFHNVCVCVVKDLDGRLCSIDGMGGERLIAAAISVNF